MSAPYRLGVLTGDRLAFGTWNWQVPSQDYLGTHTRSLGQVLDRMLQARVRQAWALGPDWPWHSDTADGWEVTRQGAEAFWWIRARGHGLNLQIANAKRAQMIGAWQSFAEAPTPTALLVSLDRLAEALDIFPVGGPGTTGDAIIRKTRPHLALERPEGPAKGSAEGDLVWIRPTKPTGRYLHAYDASAQYLSVLGGLELGEGRLFGWEELAMDRAAWEGRGGLRRFPGWWHIGRAPAELGDEYWPPLLGARPPCWVTTPTLELLLQIYDGEVVVDACQVQRGSRVLEPFYERLRRARLLGDIPRAAAKEIYTRTIGRLASRQWDRNGDPLFRPDWREAIVAQARANLYRMICYVSSQTGRLPVAVYVDELVYESDNPYPDQVGGALPPERFKPSRSAALVDVGAWDRRSKSGRPLKPDVIQLLQELAFHTENALPAEPIHAGNA